MNHIYINGRFLTQKITGVQRVAHEIINALDQLIEEGEIDKSQYTFTLISPAKGVLFRPTYKNIAVKYAGLFTGHLWEQLELPFLVKNNLLVCLCNAAPIIKTRQIVIIHDAAVFGFPQAFSVAFRSWYKIMLKALGKRAKQIITVSEFSKQELKKYCRINEMNIKIIREGKEHFVTVTPDYSILDKYHLNKDSFILAVSSMNPNKNFQAVFKAIQLLKGKKIEVVIAGGTNPKIFSSNFNAFEENVKYVGYVSDNELKALYETAACFIYPSLYEGFGLPPLEAMTCGCPVIVSEAASLPEVCGEAALYCDPLNPSDIADKIMMLMSDNVLREELRGKGYRRSEQFSWKECARQAFNVAKDL